MTDSRKGRQLGMGREISRRDFVNGFAAGTAGLAGITRGGGGAGGGRAGEQSMSQTFIQNGTIISMDPEIGDLPTGNLLIEDDRIVAVGRGFDAPGAEIVDASGMIVIPGLINAHLHTWETALRGIGGTGEARSISGSFMRISPPAIRTRIFIWGPFSVR